MLKQFISLCSLLIVTYQPLIAQEHQNQPLPQVESQPSAVIANNLIGWSLSLDGQWLSEEHIIPPRGISTNEDWYKSDVNKIGIDNISELQLYKLNFGNDTLLALVKVYENGSYRLEATKQGWKKRQDAYYYIFDAADLKSLQEISFEPTIVKIDLRDYGLLRDINADKVVSSLVKSLRILEETDRQLVVVAQRQQNSNIHFQLSSQHKVFKDVEGVLQDFTLRGESIYGLPKLLDYLHYSYKTADFFNFFNLPLASSSQP